MISTSTHQGTKRRHGSALNATKGGLTLISEWKTVLSTHPDFQHQVRIYATEQERYLIEISYCHRYVLSPFCCVIFSQEIQIPCSQGSSSWAHTIGLPQIGRRLGEALMLCTDARRIQGLKPSDTFWSLIVNSKFQAIQLPAQIN